jgi:uncharacterized protein (UPF0262 family)
VSGEESRDRLSSVTLDEASLPPASRNVEQERRIALFDLTESNSFAIIGEDKGPYALALNLEEARLVMSLAGADGAAVMVYQLSLSPFRKLIKDYFLICESYYAAIRDASPAQIEAIDMGRRGLHNEGAETLSNALQAKFKIDNETARRLFTLICALHVRS